ncbi:MAG: hypothetical protein GXY86_00560 [Firmicutes bacterium]|nr:hypothetical protein [Bacillota bacterium]
MEITNIELLQVLREQALSRAIGELESALLTFCTRDPLGRPIISEQCKNIKQAIELIKDSR